MTRAKASTAGSRVKSASGELLLEIGVEELPYQFIAPALASLQETAVRLLEAARLSCASATVYGTPRRLALAVGGLALQQRPAKQEVMGPSKLIAFDQQGQPTKAGIGFAAGQGVPVDRLEVRRTAKGEYVFAVKEEAGRPAKIVLAELLPQLIGTLSFPKAMTWNDTGIRFARPVRWIVAVFADAVLPIEVAGIRAGNLTYGHRVIGTRKPIGVRHLESYRRGLQRAGVLVDPAQRRNLIKDQVDQLCRKAGVELNADESLLDQAVYTTEWPYGVLGSFKPEYLSIPAEILMTSMKEHQGFFSVRDKKTGALAAHFIAIANNQVKDMSLIRSGNERVLAARLADAKFFYDEDRKTRLEERVKNLAGMTFHQKLGTMADKVERVRKLCGFIASQLGQEAEVVRACDRAAVLCKADLSTGIVGEFPELQGIMGGEYARHDGEPEAVAQAIREQYLPKALEGDLPRTVPGQVLSLADRLDSIAAFFHAGMIPTGSEDPFALRRHATAIVRIILEKDLRVHLGTYIEQARNLVVDSGIKGTADSEQEGRRRIADFLFERFRHYGRSINGLRDDVMDAVWRSASHAAVDLVDLRLKMNALQMVTARPEFDPLIVGFKRASRIVEKEQWERKPVDPDLFKDAAETELHRQIGMSRHDFGQKMVEGRYAKALDALIRLKPYIDAFFDGVMVNVDDAALRSNRLSLLKDVDDLFKSFADFSRIVVQGG